MDMMEEISEIVFFDLETTIENRTIIEFGAILVCPHKLLELDFYSTEVRPINLSALSAAFDRPNGINGITRDSLSNAPTFHEVADKIYDILHGRVWAGHNILEFDCPIIQEAFLEIGRSPPEPKGIIDSLILLTQKFGTRAGDMKLATLAAYFELGQQAHRSLGDVQLNLEVLKHCATVLFLESSLLDPDPFNMVLLTDQDVLASPQHDPTEGCSSYAGFLEPDEISLAYIKASLYPGTQIIQLLYKDVLFQLHCLNLRVHFGVSRRYRDKAGRPKLNIVLDTSPSLCKVLDDCDHLAKWLFVELGSNSEWKPVVMREIDFLTSTTVAFNSSTIRLQIPTGSNTDITEIYQKDAIGNPQRINYERIGVTEFDSLFSPGTFVDAFFSLEVYDYKQLAGIRLVAKKLIIHSM